MFFKPCKLASKNLIYKLASTAHTSSFRTHHASMVFGNVGRGRGAPLSNPPLCCSKPHSYELTPASVFQSVLLMCSKMRQGVFVRGSRTTSSKATMLGPLLTCQVHTSILHISFTSRSGEGLEVAMPTRILHPAWSTQGLHGVYTGSTQQLQRIPFKRVAGSFWRILISRLGLGSVRLPGASGGFRGLSG